MVKDSLYYIFSLLFILVLIHMIKEQKTFWWQWFLICICSVVITHTRNNGMYVLVLFGIAILLLYRRYWKISVLAVSISLLSSYAIKVLYIIPKEIEPGQVGEMLSVPLQQTARYIKEHYDEITEEEMDILSRMFIVEPAQLGELYKPELSDPVKENFVANPTREELKEYFGVWFSQLKRHPDTYIQAYLNQIYGYFYPGREEYWGYIGTYYIGGGKHWTALDLDMKFYMEYDEFRDMIEQEAYYIKRLPVIGMLYSCGFQNYILIGCMICLLANKKYKEMAILVPSLLTLLVCLVSPVGAYVRYMLPVMAAMPINIAWCIYAVRERQDIENHSQKVPDKKA